MNLLTQHLSKKLVSTMITASIPKNIYFYSIDNVEIETISASSKAAAKLILMRQNPNVSQKAIHVFDDEHQLTDFLSENSNEFDGYDDHCYDYADGSGDHNEEKS